MAKSDQLRYAKDVLLAYDYWRREMPSEVIQSNPSAQAIHEYGSISSNFKDFLAMVAKATDTVQKSNKDNTPDDLVRAEKKSILELKDRVRVAVSESQAAEV